MRHRCWQNRAGFAVGGYISQHGARRIDCERSIVGDTATFSVAHQVSHLFIHGRSPSQLDLFDNKPMLMKYEGQRVPADIVKDQRDAFIRPDLYAARPA